IGARMPNFRYGRASSGCIRFGPSVAAWPLADLGRGNRSMSSNSVSARLVGLATALVLLFGAVTAPPSLAKAACNNGGPGVAGTADIALVQSVSGPTGGGTLLDHLPITNYGPGTVTNPAPPL